MNSKIIISISVIITIVIIAFSISQIGEIKDEPTSNLEQNTQINSMLEKINEDRIENEKSDEPYYPKEREWIQSGPFKIDRSEYVLGEKIFINLDSMPENIKGKMIFAKIYNSTHSIQYKELGFDGSKLQNNFYFGIYPSISLGFCTSESLVGEWEVIFEGTPFDSLNFKIVNQIIPGMEEQFESVC